MRQIYWTAMLAVLFCTCSCEEDQVEEVLADQTVSLKDKLTSAVVSETNNILTAAGLVGDGKADNAATLQRLINSAAAKKSTLVLPAGKFLVSNEIILPDNASVLGQGQQTEIYLSAGNAAGRNVLRIPTQTENVTLKNLKVNANQSQNSGARLVALYVTDNSSNIVFDNVFFAGGRQSGSVQVKGLNDYPVKDIKFNNCNFLEAGSTLLELRGTQNATITNCVFQNWANYVSNSPALQLQSQDNTQTSLFNNIFSNSYGSQYAVESTASTTKQARIENNVFNDGKNIGGNGIGGVFESSSITNNRFGGSKGLQRGGLNIKGSKNILTPNVFSDNIIPVTISAPEATPAVPTAPLPATTPQVPAQNATANAIGLNGNGLIDNRDVLQNLVNSFAARKQALILPAGKFLISNEIVLPSNLTIEGLGDVTEIFLSNNSGSNRKVFRVPTRTNGIKIKNLKLNANFAGNTGANLVTFYVADNTKNISCENVVFSGGRNGGVVQVKGLDAYPVSNFSVSNCRFTEGGRTLLELRGTRDALIANNNFTRWALVTAASPALQLQSQENINVRISGNTFNNTHGKQFAIECAAAYVTNSKISDNKLNDAPGLGGNGISGYYRNTVFSSNVMTGGNGTHRSGFEVFGSNNSIINNTVNAGSIAISPGFTEDGTGVLISNNIVKTKGANVGGVQLGGGKFNLNKIKISGNTIDTRASSGNSSAIVLGTYNVTRAVSDITIEANTIYTNAHCIRVQALAGSKNVYVYRNQFKTGFSWLGVITNTVSNIVSEGNTNELANKSATYSTR